MDSNSNARFSQRFGSPSFNNSNGVPNFQIVGALGSSSLGNNSEIVDWSLEEQVLLKQGLVRYINEPNFMKYIKIAADLRDKTVRDVALRCQWLKKKEQFKRRKHELGKKIKDRKNISLKEKMMESSTMMNKNIQSTGYFPAYSQIINNVSHIGNFPLDAIDGATLSLLDENSQILRQINTNIATLNLQQNIDLIFRARNNINAIMNSMYDVPGMVKRMPALPVSLDGDLVESMLNYANQMPR